MRHNYVNQTAMDGIQFHAILAYGLIVAYKFGLYHHLEGCLACGRWGSSLGLGTTFAGAQREATKMVGRGEGKGREGKGREGKGSKDDVFPTCYPADGPRHQPHFPFSRG